MDWIEIEKSEVWNAFIDSRELGERIATLERYLYAVKDPWEMGIVQGQLRAWKEIRNFVRLHAQKERDVIARIAEERQERKVANLRSRFPRIF